MINIQIIKKNRAALFAGILCLGILLFSKEILDLTYMTNDDAGIQRALSGFGTGEPYPFHQFINCILGYIVCIAYRVCPQYQWWHIICIGCMLIGIFVMNYNLIKKSEQNSVDRNGRSIVIAFTEILIWSYFIGRSSFTIVPAIFAIGIITILLTSNKFYIARVWIAMSACLLANLFRKQTGLVITCYLVLCLIFYLFNIEERSRKIIETTILSLVLYFVLLYVCNGYSLQQYERVNSEEFLEYNAARVQYMDYPHIGYYENEDVYHNVGWDQELTSLVNQWCFLDERVNTDSFNAICAIHKDMPQNSGIKIWINLVKNNAVAFYLTSIVFLQLFFILLNVRVINIQNKILALGNLMGSLSLILYLCVQGRLPLRAYAVVLLPMFVINTFVMTSFTGEKKNKKRIGIIEIQVIVWTMIANMCILNIVYLNSDKDEILRRRQQSNAINDYLITHKDNIYISSMLGYWSNDTNMIYGNEKPNNLIFWGGSTWLSDSYYRNLETLGRNEKLTMQSLEDDNVFFVTSFIDTHNNEKIESTILSNFFSTLTDYGAILVEKVDDIGSYASVWKFVYDDSVKSFDGEYYFDGVGFYYRGGKREHGNVRIDDITYKLVETGELLRIDEAKYISLYGALEESIPE